MFLVDTNVVSAFDPRKRERLGRLGDWLRLREAELFLSVMTIAEIETGLLKLRRESKFQRAAQIETLRDDLLASFSSRILPIGVDVALEASRLAEHARPVVLEFADLAIGATASVHGLTVVTLNARHFRPMGVPVFDPGTAGLMA
jgi:toxin FitB